MPLLVHWCLSYANRRHRGRQDGICACWTSTVKYHFLWLLGRPLTPRLKLGKHNLVTVYFCPSQKATIYPGASSQLCSLAVKGDSKRQHDSSRSHAASSFWAAFRRNFPLCSLPLVGNYSLLLVSYTLSLTSICLSLTRRTGFISLLSTHPWTLYLAGLNHHSQGGGYSFLLLSL
jgi:hypothetical protein